MKKTLFFIAILSLFLGMITFQNIEPSEINASTFIDKKKDSPLLPFSIEPTLADKTISIVVGGNISLKNKKSFIIPEFLQQIFQKQDNVILHLQNQIFEENLTEIKGSPIIEKQFLQQLYSWHITSLTAFANNLYSRGKFFADLTFGNIIESDITPLISQYPQYLKKGENKIAILSINIERENTEQFIQFIKQEKQENNIIIILADDNSPTTTDISESTKNIFHSFIEAGADIIIGLGNENILPIEKYKNKIIFYSLGTFYSDEKKNGIMAEIIISPKDKQIYIHPFSFHENNFVFFNEIDSLEFFSDKNNFLQYSKAERKKLLDEKKIQLQ